MHCNTEAQCVQLVKQLPPAEAALLDWAINLMADVVQHEHLNKMNARNIAMVFAPNMTKMADPLTALIHAVQVMNFLKTLIIRTVRQRQESDSDSGPVNKDDPDLSKPNEPTRDNFLRSATLDRLGSDVEEKFWSTRKSDDESEYYSHSASSSPLKCETDKARYNGVEGILDRLSLRKGMKKLYRHPVFQLSKPVKNMGALPL